MTVSRRSSASEKKLSWREWAVMLTIPLVMTLMNYDWRAMGDLLPLLRDTFSLSDSEAASMKTFVAIVRGIAFAAMWLFGDFLPKKASFLVFVTLWIVLSIGTVMVTSEQFWLFVLLHSCAAGSVEVFSILATVLQAEHFSGKSLAWAISANSVGESIAQVIAAPVNAIFVNNKSGWRLGMLIGPVPVIPFLISSAIFLKHTKPPAMPHPLSIIQNSIGAFRIPSFVLVAISSCVGLLYSLNLGFWWSSLRLDAMETYPEVFIGMSYPLLSSIISFLTMAGMLISTLLLPFLLQLLKSQPLGLPLIYAISSVPLTFAYIVELIMLTKNAPIYLASSFVEAIFFCARSLTTIQLILIVTPANQRSSALALSRMAIAIVNMPSAQIFGAISDYFRGDSTSTSDHLKALQTTFLYTWPIQVASCVLCFVFLRFYRKDVERANELNRLNKEETAPLLCEKSEELNDDIYVHSLEI